MGLWNTLWKLSDTGTYSAVCVKSGITSKMLVVLGVLLPPRAVFSQRGCVLHTQQCGIKASQNKVLRCKVPQDSTEGYVGQREPTLHSLAHTIPTHIGNSPRALHLGSRGLHHVSLLTSCFSDVTSGDVYPCRPLCSRWLNRITF